MPTETPSTTTTEMQLDALATAYGLPVEQVLDLAIRNLVVLASFQLGAEGAPAEKVFGLLLAPNLSSNPSPKPARRMTATDGEILEAAKGFTAPFSSREIAEKLGINPGSVGRTLAAAGWPSEPQRPGLIRRWLPRAP